MTPGTWPHAATARRALPRPHTHQMLSLSATATQGVKGWNLTTEGTPGFLFRKIWSSSRVMPAQGTHGGLSPSPLRAGTLSERPTRGRPPHPAG